MDNVLKQKKCLEVAMKFHVKNDYCFLTFLTALCLLSHPTHFLNCAYCHFLLPSF